MNRETVRSSAQAVALLLIALSTSALLSCSGSDPNPDRLPNLLLITADDMGMEIGAFGDSEALTPAIDRLAADGIRFDAAYVVASTCSPSRAGILTGSYPHSNGHVGFPRYTQVRGDVRSVPDYLGKAGYFTGMIGKFMVHRDGADFPFDVFVLPDPGRTRDPNRVRRLTREFFQSAGERPFFLMVNLHAPHWRGGTSHASANSPIDAEQIPVPPTNLDTPDVRRRLASMYDAYALADRGVSAALESLDEAGLADSTLVVFLSDHGPGVPAGKGTLYESGIRTPMIARWPGVIDPGRSSKALVSAIDLLPTFVSAAGLSPGGDVEGKSLIALMRGDESEVHSAIFAESTFTQGNRYYPQRAIRTEHHKYIRNLRPDLEFHNNSIDMWGLPMMIEWDTNPRARFLLERNVRHPREELYDLLQDPWELENLAEEPEAAEVLEDLRDRLRQKLLETEDPWIALWDAVGSGSDPLEPATTKGGSFEPRWLDEALASPNLRRDYEKFFGANSPSARR